jgi:hypothetical protein
VRGRPKKKIEASRVEAPNRFGRQISRSSARGERKQDGRRHAHVEALESVTQHGLRAPCASSSRPPRRYRRFAGTHDLPSARVVTPPSHRPGEYPNRPLPYPSHRPGGTQIDPCPIPPIGRRYPNRPPALSPRWGRCGFLGYFAHTVRLFGVPFFPQCPFLPHLLHRGEVQGVGVGRPKRPRNVAPLVPSTRARGLALACAPFG